MLSLFVYNLYLPYMKATIYISGKIGKDTTLVDVIRQFKSFDEPDSVDAVIHSIGGSVEEGENIYNYLKTLDAAIPVTTITDKAYSIAAKIFAAGSERIIEDIDKALMIHFAWAKVEGNAEKLELVAEALREMEDGFAKFYSGFLGVDEDTVRSLLDNETFVSGSAAVELGFATKIKVTAEAVAEFNSINTNINKKKMTEKKSKKKAGQILLQAMAAFVGIEINAEMTLQDSNGTDVVFPDLESGDTPKVGDAATIDGSAIPDGSYIMPSLEEVTLVFVEGKVSEVVPKEEEEVEETAEQKAARLETEAAAEAAEKPKTEKKTEVKTEVNAEEIKEVSVWSVEVANTTFELGETVNYQFDGEVYPVSAGEFQLSDGRRIVTDASGVIVNIKEAEAPKQVEVDAEGSFEELLEKVSEKVKAEINAEYEIKLSEKDNEIKVLKTKIGSKEFKAEEKKIETSKEEKQNYQASVLLRRKKNN